MKINTQPWRRTGGSTPGPACTLCREQGLAGVFLTTSLHTPVGFVCEACARAIARSLSELEAG